MRPTRQDAKRRSTRAAQGFTLVELLVALTFLAVGIMSVGRLIVFAQKHAAYGRAETMAVSLAEEIREKILSDNFDDLKTIFDGVDTADPSTLTTPCEDWANHLAADLGPSGRGTISILDHTQDPEIFEGMLTVVIDISWEEDGETKHVGMRFSISKMGV